MPAAREILRAASAAFSPSRTSRLITSWAMTLWISSMSILTSGDMRFSSRRMTARTGSDMMTPPMQYLLRAWRWVWYSARSDLPWASLVRR